MFSIRHALFLEAQATRDINQAQVASRRSIKQKNTISKVDLVSYPVLTIKEYTKSSSPRTPEKAVRKNYILSLKAITVALKAPIISKSEIKMIDELECLICFEEFEDDELIRSIPCRHIFHKECIDTWLLGQSGFCPTCRLDLRITPKIEDKD
ncbi:hypothetical protein BB559_003581 [Furculomyces boomerangus]|uniref:RING-type E3 ubiquitin transferase n=2 Tax=Harpellales TaxID=61421 RepID=A0A2T9YKF2_9FUNG|nr:hypothetical protein BB559_003581 [Furculomyces boomerangus]PWA00974.1 hypothetical protein BB558_002955 [Smittium angustum]